MSANNKKYATSTATNFLGYPKYKVDFLTAIYQDMPELKGQPVTWPEQGFFNHTVKIGDCYIKTPKKNDEFRFKKTIKNLRKENFWLKELSNSKKLPLVVKAKSTKGIFNLCATKEGDGVPLYKILKLLNLEQKQQIAETFAKFTYELSKEFPVKKYRRFCITKDNLKAEKKARSNIKHTLSTIKKYKSPLQKVWGNSRYKKYSNVIKDIADIHKYSPTIITYNDFHGGNILLNKENYGEISKILDPGYMAECAFPELSPSLSKLSDTIPFPPEEIPALFSKAYYKYKEFQNGYDTLSAIQAYKEVIQVIKHTQDKTFSEETLVRVDKQLDSYKMAA